MTWHQAVWGYLMAAGLLWLSGKFLFAPGKKGPRKVFSLAYGILFFLLGSMLVLGQLFLEGPAQELANLSDAASLRGEPAPFSDSDKRFAAIWAAFWILFLLVFLVLALTLFIDLVKSRPKLQRRQSPLSPPFRGQS